MALANVAWILASNGKRVLAVDWDLEAPGLHRYFQPFLNQEELARSDGVIDFVLAYKLQAMTPIRKDEDLDQNWYIPHANILRYALPLDWVFPGNGRLDFVPAGKPSPYYSTRVNSFDWRAFYDSLGGSRFLDATKKKMQEEYDYVLIDSRTGVSDTSGICTIQLPDILVTCFTLNNQSIEGAEAVTASVDEQRSASALPIFPVPMRTEEAEKEKLQERRQYAKDRFSRYLWHLDGDDRDAYWGNVEFPYIPYYAYEETLATFVEEPGLPRSLLASAERLTSYLTKNEVVTLGPSLSDKREEIIALYAGDPAERPDFASSIAYEQLNAAERILVESGAEEEEIRRVFTRLVHVGNGREEKDTLALVSQAELGSDTRWIVQGLVKAGIASKPKKNGSEDYSVALTSNILIQRWDRLRNWIDDDREFFIWRQRLADATASWKDSTQSASLLLKPAELFRAKRYRMDREKDLNESEIAFIDASFATGRGRRARSIARVSGLTLATIGIFLWWTGGKTVVFAYKDLVFPAPLYLLLVFLGGFLVMFPQVFLYLLSLLLPGAVQESMMAYLGIGMLDPTLQRLPVPDDPVTLAHEVSVFITRYTRRLYVSLSVALLSALIVVPLLVVKLVADSNEFRESRLLAELVQRANLELSSADEFREQLRDAAPTNRRAGSATQRTYDILSRLYDPAIRANDLFRSAEVEIYEQNIKPYISSDTGLLDVSFFSQLPSGSESELSRISWLTLLATICNRRGAQGRYLVPYLQAYQLLQLATSVGPKQSIPATHNSLGLSLAGLLKNYDPYIAKFAHGASEGIRSALGQAVPLSQLALLRLAEAEYKASEQQSFGAFGRARAINNQVDLRITFLYRLHVQERFMISEITDNDDRAFLTSEFAPMIPESKWDSRKLVEVLNRLRSELDNALTLSAEPEIFFTRAQLYSVGGALGEKYNLRDGFWGSTRVVSAAALSDLRVAASLQELSKQVFEESVASEFYLDWLWKRPELSKALQDLAR